VATSNAFTNRADVLHNQHFVELIGKDAANPIIAINKCHSIWDERHDLSRKSDNMTAILRAIIIVSFSGYLWKNSQGALLSYLFINNNRLFGFLNVMSQLETTKNISSGRLSNTFTMIEGAMERNSVIDVVPTSPDEKSSLMRSSNESKNICADIKTIQIIDIKQVINETIKLEFKGMIDIDLNESGIILLNGKKGCGKSVTMDILAGQYDGKVTGSMTIDGVPAQNEFRDLDDRIYIRQCIVDDYLANRKKTITFSLSELFPKATKSEIEDYLTHFGLLHKIKHLEMTQPVSKDERGLSPGERQSIVLASAIWKAIKLNCRFLLLDEPERNIDFETIKWIFDNILCVPKYRLKIVLITHLSELKDYLYAKRVVKQTWRYPENSGGTLTFIIENH